ncbi:MAG: GFA family protein, partial [Pseudomonadota bacterium]
MTAEAPLLGGCACGAARYALSAPPLFVHACWCKECRRLTGGAFAHNLLIEADRVRLTAGEIRDVPAPGASGMPQRIFRCTACASALWSLYGGREAIRFVRGGR